MKKLILTSKKDENGMYLKDSVKPNTLEQDDSKDDISLDDIAKRIVLALDRATKQLLTSITAGDVSREVIGSLKDCETMHRELAKKEKEFLENASDEQLQKLLK